MQLVAPKTTQHIIADIVERTVITFQGIVQLRIIVQTHVSQNPTFAEDDKVNRELDKTINLCLREIKDYVDVNLYDLDGIK